ncbi:hypothetical protein VQ7734_03227 [Vibrio quintilis]|uniref:Uncharacterized protein n=1 Tax=Vibrio quintilis TaxID=1117707 RepID=A0A1M7YXV8_9VIBR|nr:hypothetical protein VQ7734_03227 [Vibrio quintilis]
MLRPVRLQPAAVLYVLWRGQWRLRRRLFSDLPAAPACLPLPEFVSELQSEMLRPVRLQPAAVLYVLWRGQSRLRRRLFYLRVCPVSWLPLCFLLRLSLLSVLWPAACELHEGASFHCYPALMHLPDGLLPVWLLHGQWRRQRPV